MGILTDVGSGLIEKWDLERVQLTALRKVQRRFGVGVGVSMPADGPSRSRRRAKRRFKLKPVLYAIVGLIGVMGVLSPSFFYGLTFSYTLIMLMVGLTLLGSFTSVLLDTSENRILFHLPISDRTLLAARILRLAEDFWLLALAISLPTAVALAVRFGAVALLVFAISLFLTLILIVAIALATCLFALRYVKPDRIRHGILLSQVALSALGCYAGSAVINSDVPLVERLPDLAGGAGWYFYPPGWMAGLLEFLLMEKTRFNGVLAALAVLVPLAGFIGCIALFAGRRFMALLSRLEVVPRSATKPKRSPSWLARLSALLTVLITGDRQERAVFDLTSKLMKRDQLLSFVVYSGIGVMLLNIGLFVAVNHNHGIQDAPLTFFYVNCYTPIFLAIMGPGIIQHSAEWRAAWCYEVLPFARPGVIVAGTMKAYICKYVLPVYVFLLVVSAAVWGTAPALHVLFTAAVLTLVCVRQFSSATGVLPYSREWVSAARRNDGRASKWGFIPISVGLIVAHVVLNAVAGSWGLVVGIVAMGGAIIVAYRKLRLMSSKDVEAPDHHVAWHRS